LPCGGGRRFPQGLAATLVDSARAEVIIAVTFLQQFRKKSRLARLCSALLLQRQLWSATN
jgi:hypothetical protein